MYKEITIYDLGKALNLSAATISRALNDHPSINRDTKKKVVEIAKQLGYRSNNIASNLRMQKNYTIGVILHRLNSNFTTSVLAGIEKVTTASNYDLVIGHSSEIAAKEVINVHNFFNNRIDGLIATLAFDTENLDHYEPFFNRNIPVVFFDRVDESSKGVKVTIDNFKAGYEATKHLIDQGCKRIVHITSNLNRNVYLQRYNGYLSALNENNIPFDESLLFINDLSKDSCTICAKHIANLIPLPDGIFTANDLSAAICIQVLKEHNIKIPNDIAVVGFNNDLISTIIEPQLTTINYPGINMGEVAATHLLNQLQGKKVDNNNYTIILKSELIIRNSSLKKLN